MGEGRDYDWVGCMEGLLGDITYVCVCVCVRLVAQLCPTPCDPMDCSPPGSSVRVQDSPGRRILKWVAYPFSMDNMYIYT